jgi:hypothetical protein
MNEAVAVSTFNIHLHTQYCENYGDEAKPYWKFKGGETYVITGFNHPLNDRIGAAAAAVVDAMRARVEYANGMSEEYLLDWELVPASELTQSERDQLEFDGRITDPSQRIAL